MDLSKLCRSCMKEVALWELQNFNEETVGMFTFSTKIQIIKDEPKLPKQFCYECKIKMESSYKYIKKAHEVDMILKNIALRIIKIETENTQNKKSQETQFSNYENDDLFNYEENHSPLSQENNRTELSYQQNLSFVDKYTELAEVQKTFDLEIRKKPEFICDICNKIYLLKGYLKRHLQRKHTDIFRKKKLRVKEETIDRNSCENEIILVNDFTCPLCRRHFKSKLWFSRHMERAHADPKAHICPHCPKTFSTPHRMRYHLLSHSSDRPFPCACGAAFSTRGRFAAHALTHSDDRPYACVKCDMRFKVKSILTKHMKVHENEKPFLCHVCGLGFNLAYTLEVHIRRHTGERPHSCPHCKFVTTTLSCLVRHKRRHRASRPHACATCQKRFYERGELSRHIRTHTGARPYRCPRCALSFTDSWKRKTHLMRVHHFTLQDIPPLTIDGRLRET